MIQRDPDYAPGKRVLVEGVITDFNFTEPLGAVTVAFPTGTDEAGLVDGPRVVLPQVMVNIPGVHVLDLNGYIAAEGYYPEDAA